MMYTTFINTDGEYRYSYATEEATMIVVVRNLNERFNIFLPVSNEDLDVIKERIGACGHFSIEKATIIGYGKVINDVDLDSLNIVAGLFSERLTRKLNHINDLVFDVGMGILPVDNTNELLAMFSLTGNEIRIMNNRYRYMTVSELHNGKVINPFDEIDSNSHYTLKVVMIGRRKAVLPVKDNRKEFFKIS